MRIMSFALTSSALVVAGMLAVCAVDPASAASAKARSCNGKFQAYENGQCVSTRYVNPDRIPDPCGGGACYRSGSQKHKKHHTSG
jgi:hypothetical protein